MAQVLIPQMALMTDDDPFRVANRRITKSLFYETTLADKSLVVYTLKDKDHLGYPSLYRLYMEHDDPTEYTFAVACLDSWDHWMMLCECSWFKPYLTAWRKELEIRARSRALASIKTLANDKSSKEHYQASKFMVSGGWVEKGKGRSAGRPSKDEIAKEAQRIAQSSRDLEDDFQRITGAPN